MGRTQVPGTQVKDATINTVDLVDKAVSLQKMAVVASGSVFIEKPLEWVRLKSRLSIH